MSNRDSSGERLPPARLFKYRRLPSAGSPEEKYRRLELGGVLYFSPPSKLNDPFDCRPSFRLDASESDIREYIQRRGRGRSEEEQRWATARTHDQDWWYEAWERQGERHGHYCLSEVSDSSLMWAHYADGHRGYCLQFEIANKEWRELLPLPISYQPVRPEVSTSDFMRHTGKSPPPGFFTSAFLTKHESWSYEKEWRVIRVGGAGSSPIPGTVITGVILGSKMHEADADRLRAWARSHHKKLYRAKMSRRDYRVEISEDG